MIAGVDKSHLNAPFPISQLMANGRVFAWIKAAQWLIGEDKAFNATWQEAKDTPGFFRGAYFFFDPRYDGIAQCKLLLSLGINFSAPYCMGGCVDVEDLVVFDANGKVDAVLTAQANQWVKDNWTLAVQRLNDFLTYFKQQTGEACIIYTYNNYMREYYRSTPFTNNPMWLSSIQDTCPERYDNGEAPLFWQYTYGWNDTDLDGDYFTGTQEELNLLANVS